MIVDNLKAEPKLSSCLNLAAIKFVIRYSKSQVKKKAVGCGPSSFVVQGWGYSILRGIPYSRILPPGYPILIPYPPDTQTAWITHPLEGTWDQKIPYPLPCEQNGIRLPATSLAGGKNCLGHLTWRTWRPHPPRLRTSSGSRSTRPRHSTRGRAARQTPAPCCRFLACCARPAWPPSNLQCKKAIV